MGGAKVGGGKSEWRTLRELKARARPELSAPARLIRHGSRCEAPVKHSTAEKAYPWCKSPDGYFIAESPPGRYWCVPGRLYEAMQHHVAYKGWGYPGVGVVPTWPDEVPGGPNGRRPVNRKTNCVTYTAGILAMMLGPSVWDRRDDVLMYAENIQHDYFCGVRAMADLFGGEVGHDLSEPGLYLVQNQHYGKGAQGHSMLVGVLAPGRTLILESQDGVGPRMAGASRGRIGELIVPGDEFAKRLEWYGNRAARRGAVSRWLAWQVQP